MEKKVVTIRASMSTPEKIRCGFMSAQIAILCILSVLSTVLVVNAIPPKPTPPAVYTVSLVSIHQWNNATKFKASYRVTEGEKLTLPTPERYSRTFIGWYTNPAHSVPFTPSTTAITGDLRLYAGFKYNVYTVTFIDPRQYFVVVDGEVTSDINHEYTPFAETKYIGSSFPFPQRPTAPNEGELAHFGTFRGWSLSMHNKTGGEEPPNVFAQPNDVIENPFLQNVTYWAAFDGWDLPTVEDTGTVMTGAVLVNIPHERRKLLFEYPDFPPDYPFEAIDEYPHMSDRPMTLPCMPYTILNDGLMAYSFAGWILDAQYTDGDRIFHSGESVIPQLYADYFTQITVNSYKILFHALWIADNGTTTVLTTKLIS
jgi:uncharacterized repeat protein (TIGR02543 family)